MNNWETIKQKTMKALRPTEEDQTQIMDFAEETINQLNKILKNKGIDAVAELHGSVAHGTWIRGQQDLDIFIVIDHFESREQLMQVLEAVKNGTDWVLIEAYAEHPYLKTEINGYNIDIVPCFKSLGKLHSSTDRTPLHTEWLNPRLVGLGNEVRLIKKYLMVLGLYGAEIKVGGFSGYLCELLIIHYGGFWSLVEAAAGWGQKEEIIFDRKRGRWFKDSLTVIDPVDLGRNVASSLRKEAYWQFISASRSFMKNPRRSFFLEKETKVKPSEVNEILKSRLTDILFLVVEESKAEVPDTLWGQLHKSRQAIENQLTNYGFNCLRSTSWSNEENRHIFIYELRSVTIPGTIKHFGPPAYLESNVNVFIDTYLDNPRTVSGPQLEGDKWYVVLKKKFTVVKNLMDKILVDGGREIGVSKKIAVRILQHNRVLVNEEIEQYLFDGFEGFLWDWLKGRPSWIE
jgi:tRNA nucleotidyltransferase (CCA-adding enzyme)